MTVPQNMKALAKANDKRLKRSSLKRQVAEGRMGVMSAIVDPCCDTAFVTDVLCWQRKWAAGRSDKLLHDLGFNPAVLCGSLTVRQRQQLAKMLRAGTVWQRDLVAWEESQQWRMGA